MPARTTKAAETTTRRRRRSTSVAATETTGVSKPKSARSTKQEVVENNKEFFDIGQMLDELQDETDKKYGLVSSVLERSSDRMSTGILSLDLLLYGGIQPGGWYTIYGPEQSAKSTLAMTILAQALHARMTKGSKFACGIFDYEGSVDEEYTGNIIKSLGIKGNAAQIFGVRDDDGGWEIPPLARYYSHDVGDDFFKALAKIRRGLPDKQTINGEPCYLFEHTKANKSKFAGMYDTKYLSRNNKIKVPAPDGFMQGLYLCDSYPAMLPDGLDDDDRNSGMAEQARMFSEGIKKVKGGMRKKAMTVIGINQLRLRPATMFGNPEYEPCGEALKFFCFHPTTNLFTKDGLVTGQEFYDSGSMSKILGSKGLEKPTIFDSTGYSQISCLTTELGNFIKAKPGHRTLSIQNRGCMPEWTKLSSFTGTVDRYVPVKVGSDIWSDTDALLDFESFSKYDNDVCISSVPESMSPKLAYVLGSLCGDGHVPGTGVIHFVTQDEDTMDFFLECFEESFSLSGLEYRQVDNKFEFSLSSRRISNFLGYLGSTGTSRTKSVPWAVRTSTKKSCLMFLRGLFDSDGNVGPKGIGLSTTSKLLSEQVHLMLLNLGCIARLKRKDHDYHEHKELNAVYNISCSGSNAVRLYESVGLTSARKAEAFESKSTGDHTHNEMYSLDLIPFDVLPTGRQKFQKLEGLLAECKGRGAYYRISRFTEDWFDEAFGFVETLRTEHEREKYQNFLITLSKFIDYTSENSLFWTKVVSVDHNLERSMTYDANMPKTHSIVTNGIVSHNSDVRIKSTPRSTGPSGFVVNKGIVEEPSVTGRGKDTYRFLRLKTTKNKLGGMPQQECWARIWISDGTGTARGLDPAFDTFEYLSLLGMVSGNKNNYKFSEDCPLHGAKKIDWQTFKRLVLCPPKEIKQICEEQGIKPVKIREWCQKRCANGTHPKLFKEILVSATTGKKSDDDDE